MPRTLPTTLVYGHEQIPLSVLLDVFQSIQKKGIPFMLVLAGLPTLFPKLVDARTYAERMFRVMTLGRLNEEDSRAAIMKPIEEADCPVKFTEDSVGLISQESAGYPYFIQFICREVYDVFIQQHAAEEQRAVPIEAIQRKLDADFFAGRWRGSPTANGKCSGCWVAHLDQRRGGIFTIQELDRGSQRAPGAGSPSPQPRQPDAGQPGRAMIFTRTDRQVLEQAVVRHLRERPTVMKRWVDGVEGEPFFQKRVPDSAPEWIETATVTFPSGRHARELCPTTPRTSSWASTWA